MESCVVRWLRAAVAPCSLESSLVTGWFRESTLVYGPIGTSNGGSTPKGKRNLSVENEHSAPEGIRDRDMSEG